MRHSTVQKIGYKYKFSWISIIDASEFQGDLDRFGNYFSES